MHNLYRHLAACDLAVVQGGLTTAMELTAGGGRSCTSRCAITSSRTCTSPTGWTATERAGGWTSRHADPDLIAGAIAEEIKRSVQYREVETDGARRAAETLAELL